MAHKERIMSADEKKLVAALNEFTKWLVKKNVIEESEELNRLVDFPFSRNDWVMRVEDDTVSFNTQLLKLCSYEYYQAVVLHEAFHLMVQKVPNKEDAVRVKDSFGNQLMKLIDIEADFYTALYYKEKLKHSLVNYLGMYYDGRMAFSDPRIRTVKFERFIGSLLSVAKLFIEYPDKRSVANKYDLYLPTITPVYTEDRMHVLVVKKEHIYLDEIKASHNDFVTLKECYSNPNNFKKAAYVDKLITFVYHAFNKEIPKEVKNEISKIKD